jgi:flavodoxin
MKTLIIYVSILQGNTKKVAEAMAQVLDAKLIEPEEVDIDSLAHYDLIGLGSGVYWGRFYKRLRNFIKKLPHVRYKKVFIFGTLGHGKVPSKQIEKPLKKKGYTMVGNFSCLGYDTFLLSRIFGMTNKGRPDTEDFRQAKEFAKGLTERIG